MAAIRCIGLERERARETRGGGRGEGKRRDDLPLVTSWIEEKGVDGGREGGRRVKGVLLLW